MKMRVWKERGTEGGRCGRRCGRPLSTQSPVVALRGGARTHECAHASRHACSDKRKNAFQSRDRTRPDPRWWCMWLRRLLRPRSGMWLRHLLVNVLLRPEAQPTSFNVCRYISKYRCLERLIYINTSVMSFAPFSPQRRGVARSNAASTSFTGLNKPSATSLLLTRQ